MPKKLNDPRRDTREKVANLRGAGLTVAQIAGALGITKARVYQHLDALGLERRPYRRQA